MGCRQLKGLIGKRLIRSGKDTANYNLQSYYPGRFMTQGIWAPSLKTLIDAHAQETPKPSTSSYQVSIWMSVDDTPMGNIKYSTYFLSLSYTFNFTYGK